MYRFQFLIRSENRFFSTVKQKLAINRSAVLARHRGDAARLSFTRVFLLWFGLVATVTVALYDSDVNALYLIFYCSSFLINAQFYSRDECGAQLVVFACC